MTETDQRGVRDRIEEEASLWLARRRLEEPGEFDEVGFSAWLAQDPQHGSAFRFVSLAEGAAVAALGGRRACVTELPRSRPTRAHFAITGFALAAAAAVAMFIVGVPTQETAPVGVRTEVAQVRRVTLIDGSVVTLGPATQMDTAFTDQERRVTLTSGEAFFEVARNADRPFYVTAGDATVRVVGTKFDVRITDGAVRVAVADGVVQVRPTNAREQMVLRAGDAVRVAAASSANAGAPPIVTRLPSADAINAGMWREGRFVYVEAPLGDLVSDLNRYYPPGVRLADPDLAGYRLTAAFRANELDTFFSTLPDAAPVVVRRASDGAVTIARAN